MTDNSVGCDYHTSDPKGASPVDALDSGFIAIV